MLCKLNLVKVMPYVVPLAMAFSSIAFAQSGSNSLLSPNNPNCSPGVEGCTANYATTDHSDNVPKGDRAAASPTDHLQDAPTKGTTVYSTTDHSDDVPQRRANFPPQH